MDVSPMTVKSRSVDAGARLRLGGRRAVFVEYAGTLVRNVTRNSVHVGLEALFGDLAR